MVSVRLKGIVKVQDQQSSHILFRSTVGAWRLGAVTRCVIVFSALPPVSAPAPPTHFSERPEK